MTDEPLLEPTGEVLDLVLEATSTGLWRWDVASDRVWWSAQVWGIHGLQRDQFDGTGAGFFRLVHPDDQQRVRQSVLAAIAERRLYSEEFRIVRPDGSVRWVTNRGRAVADDAAGLTVVGTITDVTDSHALVRQLADERQAAERALRASETRTALAMEAGRMAAWEYDVARGHLASNERLRRLLGMPPDPRADGSSGSWLDAVHPDDRARVHAAIDDAVASRAAFDTSFRVVGEGGAVRWFAGLAQTVEDDHEGVALVGVLQDITDQRHAELELTRAHERLREATLAGGLGIHEFDPATGTLIWDAQLRQWWGLSPDEEPTYDKFVARLHPDDRPAMQAAVDRALEPGSGGRYDAEYRVLHPDGTARTVRATGNVTFSGGQATRLVGTVQDVTRDRQLSAALSLADRRKDVFLATLSHELRNPLAPIQTAAQLLGSRQLDEHQMGWARAVIQRQVRHIALLLDDLLDVSRITQGKLTLKPQDVSLPAVVDAAVETARPRVDRRHQRLTITLPEDATSIHVDALRLSQVLSNLLNNAAKYTDPGGHIELLARRDGADLVISVVDDGIGIAADVLPTLFEMFAQDEKALSRSEGGLGIGLALAKGLVELHGGSIEAHSEGRGKGSVFVVRLPGVVRVAPVETDDEAAASGSAPRRVMVVDDSIDGADSLAMLLQVQGHHARAAYGGAEALTLARSFLPEIAIVDIDMPGMDGLSLARSLRAEPWGASLRLVALTGYGQDQDRRATAAAGFDHHLIKPVDLPALGRLLGAWPAPG